MGRFRLRTLPLLFAVVAAAPLRAAELVTPPPPPIERIRGLADRWESGALSADEKDELLRSVITELLRTGALEPSARPHGQPAAPTAGPSAGRVIAVYPDRNTTQLVIEARQPLVAGSLVYAGPEEVQATLDDLMARSGDLYYYSASTPGKARIRASDSVVTQKSRTLESPSALQLKIQETYTFEQKRLAEVTAVQDGRAMIDRGTLHEVRERDIYKIFDSRGAYKGFLEIRGIGDLQSSGVLYNRMEDGHHRALTTVPGDRSVFVGQRKLMALGILAGFAPRRREEFGKHEEADGGGLAWDLMFKNGWGVELLFGGYQRVMSASKRVVEPPEPSLKNVTNVEKFDMKVVYYAPFVVKKNFFFPSVVSPFVVVGGSVVRASLQFYELYQDPNAFPSPVFHENAWTASRTTVAPIAGAGVDFFPARLIRPRVDARWFAGPTLRAGHKTLNTEMLTLSFSLFSAW